jgi:hypothetical protein
VDPEILRAGMRLGILVALLAAVTLPFQDPASASFVVDVLALIVGVVFVGGVALLTRRASTPMPSDRRDSAQDTRYNVRDPHGSRSGARTPGGREE